MQETMGARIARLRKAQGPAAAMLVLSAMQQLAPQAVSFEGGHGGNSPVPLAQINTK